jgi:hypothetical protein
MSRTCTHSLTASGDFVRIDAAPFTMFHELEPAYVLGSFRLKAMDRGFLITEDGPLKIGEPTPADVTGPGWNAQA